MQDNSKTDIIIRDMQESDVPLIILSAKEQGLDLEVEKFYVRLEEQSQGKNFALVAEYKGVIAGYVYIYPFSHNGLFKDEDYTEISNLFVLKKYKDLGVDDELMSAAEKIASGFSDLVYLCVDVHDWKTLNKCIKRNFTPHFSGVWNKNEMYCSDDCQNHENEDKFIFWLYKNLNENHLYKFSVRNTLEHPFLSWIQGNVKTAFVTVNTERCREMKIGNLISLTDRHNMAYIKGFVTFKHEYATIREMLKSEGVKNICPFLNDDEIEKGVQFYQNLANFHCVNEYGCVALGVKVIESKL